MKTALFLFSVLGWLSLEADSLTVSEFNTALADMETYFQNDNTFLPTVVRLGE